MAPLQSAMQWFFRVLVRNAKILRETITFPVPANGKIHLTVYCFQLGIALECWHGTAQNICTHMKAEENLRDLVF
jgi:hypothetical protein